MSITPSPPGGQHIDSLFAVTAPRSLCPPPLNQLESDSHHGATLKERGCAGPSMPSISARTLCKQYSWAQGAETISTCQVA